jgi:tetratricopeptide (TPR) repeat protein
VPVAYKNRGTYLAKNGRNDKALQDFNKYLELNPKDPLIFSNRGNLFSMQAKYDDAIRDYTASLKLDSTSHEAWFNRGYTCFLMRRYSEAVHDYTVAMGLNSELKERALANRAMALVESGDPIKSLQDVDQLLFLDKSNSEYHHIGAIAYLRMEQVQKAIDMVNEAIRINEGVANYYNTRAVCNNKLGLKDQTIEDLLKAKSLGYPVDDNLLRSLGHTP